MKITKLGHSCLLVEMPEPVNRTILFDPGAWSKVDVDSLQYLDDIVITHEHADHCDVSLIQSLVKKFPNVRVKTPATLVPKLEGISTETEAVEGIEIFGAPHEGHGPFIQPPENIGVHYLGVLTNPGDCHNFLESKDILALPITAPWGSVDRAVQLSLQLKPKHILPIHDWHWHDQARTEMYDRLELLFKDNDITFHKLEHGTPTVIDI
jgi:L-ascorbate metabolism protein UlaG (beta-lactamase superfamily)